jgi:DNA-binding FadR family transcriptional regulator
MPLAPIAKSTLADDVEQRLLAYIHDADLEPGDPFPGEEELATKLGVSRGVVREAMSRLRMLGVLDARRRRGTVLQEPDPFLGFERALDAGVFSEDTWAELTELRLIVEMGLTELILQRVTPAMAEELLALAEAIESATERDAVIAADLRFHEYLCTVAGNQLANRFQSLLASFFAAARNRPGKTYRLGRHRELAQALAGGDAEQFRLLMREHFQPHLDRVGKQRENRR